MKWIEDLGITCDKRISIWLKVEFYRIVVRPIIFYGLDCWVIEMGIEQSISVVDMRIIR